MPWCILSRQTDRRAGINHWLGCYCVLLCSLCLCLFLALRPLSVLSVCFLFVGFGMFPFFVILTWLFFDSPEMMIDGLDDLMASWSVGRSVGLSVDQFTRACTITGVRR